MSANIFSPKNRAFAALLGGKVDRPPVSSIGGCAGTVCVEMEEKVGIYFPDAHKDAEKMAKLAIASYELSGLECIRVPFDFVIEPEVLGCKIKWVEKKDFVPMVIEHPYKSPEELKISEDILEKGRIPVVLEAIRIIRREVGDLLPISSLVLGPFTLVGELVGVDKLMVWCLRKKDWIKELMEKVTPFLIDWAKAQYRAGSDIVEVGEPTASPELISPEMFREFVKPYLTRIAESLGGLKVLHICGDSTKIIKDMAECGYHGISIEEAVDLKWAKSIVGDVKILGNVSSKKTLWMGKPEDVKKETIKAIEAGADLIEPGCGIPPIAPLANVRAMVEAVLEYFKNK